MFTPLPTPNNIHVVLTDYEPRIRVLLEDAWGEWLKIPDRARFSARSRASMVFDFIRRRAIAEFDGDPNIRIIIKEQTVQFLFRDKVLIRFKKANDAGLGSNIETQAVLQFVDPQMAIPGLLPDIHCVEVCYHLDELATKLKELTVTARERNHKLWSYPLEKSASSNVIPLPPRPPSGDSPPKVRVRRPKPESDMQE